MLPHQRGRFARLLSGILTPETLSAIAKLLYRISLSWTPVSFEVFVKRCLTRESASLMHVTLLAL